MKPEFILEHAKSWFREVIVENHKRNTEKLADINQFDVNPFLNVYLSNYLTGNNTPESLAKALIYPRVLGTSITTSFGTNIQRFQTEVLGKSFGSGITGVDVEFIDHQDKRRKYCQLKLGPNTINKSDIKTIVDEFSTLRRKARLDNLSLGTNDAIVGILFGEHDDLNQFYKKIETDHHIPIYVGRDFWFRLTGDKNFYQKLIRIFGEVATECDGRSIIEATVKKLSKSPELLSIYKSTQIKS